jgi:WXG100 family type VII secretion target
MSQISVRPDHLNAIAQALRMHGQRIQTAIEAIDAEMRRLNADSFAGQSADVLHAHYQRLRQRLMTFSPMLTRFANQLDEAAAAFRRADLAESGSGAAQPAGTWNLSGPVAGADPGMATLTEHARAVQDATRAATWRLW